MLEYFTKDFFATLTEHDEKWDLFDYYCKRCSYELDQTSGHSWITGTGFRTESNTYRITNYFSYFARVAFKGGNIQVKFQKLDTSTGAYYDSDDGCPKLSGQVSKNALKKAILNNKYVIRAIEEQTFAYGWG